MVALLAHIALNYLKYLLSKREKTIDNCFFEVLN